MKINQVYRVMGIVTNAAVVVGLVFLIVEFRQNRASLDTSNYWALTETSNQVWESLAENQELARLELARTTGEALSGVDSVRYAAWVWLRLEQVWTAYDLYRRGVFSNEEWQGLIAGTRRRAAQDNFWATEIEESGMPEELKTALLSDER